MYLDENDIPEDSKSEILRISNDDNTMIIKLTELWKLYEIIHNPIENKNYKPIDKYAHYNDPYAQIEGEFILFINQLHYIPSNLQMMEIEEEIAKYKE